jgi:sigma-B regulation protein RsbU (phosphoserine phosphatase)
MSQEKKILINLESLLGLSAQLNESNDDKSILGIALLSLMGKLKIFRGIVFIPDENGNNFVVQQSKGKNSIDKIPAFQINGICNVKDKQSLAGSCYEICIPVVYRKQLLAVICLSKKIDSLDLSDEEYYYASLVSTITANAINNARNIKLLLNEKTIVEQRNQLLTTLFEVSRDFNIFLTAEKIIKTLSYNLQGQLMISKFAVIYLNEESEKSDITHFDILINSFRQNLPNDELNQILDIKDTSFVDELVFKGKMKEWFKNNAVAVISPMTVQNKIRGYLLIGHKIGKIHFSEENLLFIKVIGNTAVLTLENLKLIEKEVERQKLENELSIALEIQKKLLPKAMPKVKGFDIYGMSQPSRLVGGDYFDFIELPDNKLLIAIADVSGKGMPAALLMANVQAALRALAPLEIPLKKMLNMINSIVFKNTEADKFVTFFCGILDIEKQLFKYINAGHNPPILTKANGSIELLQSGGIILGVLDNEIDYTVSEIQLSELDTIVFYTDGISEERNRNREEFGEKRLMNLIKSKSNENSRELVNSIIREVKLFAVADTQSDDITLISLKVKP